jgi:O-acetyl-ADP-ribose deacetylase
MRRIELIRGDITRVDADAIVNAANSSLLGGGGVDGAIHRAAGPALLEACRKLKGCPPGEAKITDGFNLKAKYVIHTVGPVWQGGNAGEDVLLENCYVNSLKLAATHHFKTVAFPNISTGIYGFPKDRAAGIAVNTVKKWLESHPEPEKVIFVVFDEDNAIIYNQILD